MAAPKSKDLQCTKCGGTMEPGVVFDRGYGNIRMTPQWCKGGRTAEFSWRKGLTVPAGRVRKVASWRCTGCGFLESYAK